MSNLISSYLLLALTEVPIDGLKEAREKVLKFLFDTIFEVLCLIVELFLAPARDLTGDSF